MSLGKIVTMYTFPLEFKEGRDRCLPSSQSERQLLCPFHHLSPIFELKHSVELTVSQLLPIPVDLHTLPDSTLRDTHTDTAQHRALNLHGFYKFFFNKMHFTFFCNKI